MIKYQKSIAMVYHESAHGINWKATTALDAEQYGTKVESNLICHFGLSRKWQEPDVLSVR